MKIISMKRNFFILSIESVAKPLWSAQPDSYGTNGSRYEDDQNGDRQNDVAVNNHLVFVFPIWKSQIYFSNANLTLFDNLT
jgi:hypothetical protein